MLAVCAGFQMMGHSFPGPDGRACAGVSLLDVDTVRGTGRRAVGEVLADALDPPSGVTVPATVLPLGRLTGFENHAGVTRLGPSTRPLGRVVAGIGNGAGSAVDGAWAGRVVGTYMHGPVLARNPRLADLLLASATGVVPTPLDDDEEEALHAERIRSVSGTAGATGGGWRRLVGVRRT